jgi:hypothetical protein
MSDANNNKKPKPQPAKTLAKVAFVSLKDDAAKKQMPALLDVLLPIWQDNVMVRQPAILKITPDGGHWRCVIECPTEGLQAQFMCDSLSTLLGDLDALLSSGKTAWAMSWQRRKKSLPVIDDLIQ